MGGMRYGLRFEEDTVGIDGMYGFSFNLLELLVLNAFHLPRIGLLALLFALPLFVSAVNDFFEL
jgi:hypothetical protein